MITQPLLALPLVFTGLIGGLMLSCCHGKGRAGGRGVFHKEHAKWIEKKLIKELDLDEKQQKVLNRIHDELTARQEECGPVHQRMKESILSKIRRESLDKDALKESFQSGKECKEDMHEFFLSKMAEFHAVLTPEQRDKLADKIGKMRPHGHGCHH